MPDEKCENMKKIRTIAEALLADEIWKPWGIYILKKLLYYIEA